MRQIVIDTETTGLETKDGHRIIEIGCVELVNRRPTGNNWHHYLNPQREVEAEAITVHGITNEFLQNKPVFADVLEDFLVYINEAELIAHNAEFDVGFINYEMKLLKKSAKPLSKYAKILDTLPLARKMFPGQRNSLDALCKRFKINLSERKLHGALLDAHLLTEVYLSMTGGQTNLFGDFEFIDTQTTQTSTLNSIALKKPLIIVEPSTEELALHQKQLFAIQKKSGKCLWAQQ